MTRSLIASLFFLGAYFGAAAQEQSLDYRIGEKYDDKYKYSNMLAMADDGNGGTVVVRSYYQGIVLRPKGYLVEHYDQGLNLLTEYNYKLREANFVEAFVKNGQVYLLFLEYDQDAAAYEYIVHRSPYDAPNFTQEVILSIPSEPVQQPLDRNFYNRNFSNGFTTSVLFNTEKTAFAITTHFKKGKVEQHYVHVFNASLQKIMEHDFSDEVEQKNYAFENIAFSPDMKNVYLTGKAYFKKKRFNGTERKFQYELVRISATDRSVQSFYVPGKFPEAIKPVFKGNELLCLGFYADRKDNRYNGIAYYRIAPNTLEILDAKYNAFSSQFMLDKFGREDDKTIKDLVFKGIDFTADGNILFNAEEQFTTTGTQANASGGRVQITRYHYNDIVSAKLNAQGNLVWARNINKTEVTQGDDAYTSYAPYTKGNDTYFFISTASETPQQIGTERILFKQGMGRYRNVFWIKLNDKGEMGYEKLIDDKEARLPLMVSRPLVDRATDQLMFYAKRGTKKQLVQVRLN